MDRYTKILSACCGINLQFILFSASLVAEPVATAPTEVIESNTAIIPVDRKEQKGWHERHEWFNKIAREKHYDLVFLGDSITQGWEGAGKDIWEKFYKERNALNLGIGGDRTEHVIWRLQHGNLENIQPKALVLMIGTNNTGYRLQNPEEVAEGIKKIVDILCEELPKTKIILLAIFPRGENSADEKRMNNLAINHIIKDFHNGENLHYLDIGNTFLESDGTLSREIMPDLLHLSPKGYELWADAIEEKIAEFGL